MKKTLFFLFLIIGLISSSCRKNDDIITGGPVPVIYVQTQIAGVIHGENGIGLEGVVVRWGQQSVTSDENGYFAFAGAAADREGTVLQITANGYFNLSKTVQPIANGQTWLEAQLTPKTLSGTVQASVGGSVSVTGATVTLPAGGIVGAGNVAYSGMVNVYATWLDPTDGATLARMPGNLSAIRENGDAAALATYGMIGVELESPAGEPLQIAPGAQAQIIMSIPASILANAPVSIPLWHFDVTKGKWIEDGFAEKVGSTYVGSVSHFSFWNCDVPFDNVNLSGKVVDGSGAPVIGIWVRASLANGGSGNIPASGSAWTNNIGAFSGKVPANEVLIIEILDQCGAVIYTQEIGPLSVDLNMGNLVANLSDKSINLTGTLVDCNGDPVSTGYFKINVEGSTVILNLATDGTVNAVIPTCDADELIAIGYDFGNLKSSPIFTYSIAGVNSLDLGQVEACDELTELIEYTLDGITTFIVDPAGGIQGNLMTINSGLNSPDSTYLYFSLNATSPGTYVPTVVEASSFDPANGGTFSFGYCQGCADMEVTITSVGLVGELIIGTFTGTLDGNPSNPDVPLSGSFKVIRDF